VIKVLMTLQAADGARHGHAADQPVAQLPVTITNDFADPLACPLTNAHGSQQ
jgi:hypothetical protein